MIRSLCARTARRQKTHSSVRLKSGHAWRITQRTMPQVINIVALTIELRTSGQQTERLSTRFGVAPRSRDARETARGQTIGSRTEERQLCKPQGCIAMNGQSLLHATGLTRHLHVPPHDGRVRKMDIVGLPLLEITLVRARSREADSTGRRRKLIVVLAATGPRKLHTLPVRGSQIQVWQRVLTVKGNLPKLRCLRSRTAIPARRSQMPTSLLQQSCFDLRQRPVGVNPVPMEISIPQMSNTTSPSLGDGVALLGLEKAHALKQKFKQRTFHVNSYKPHPIWKISQSIIRVYL